MNPDKAARGFEIARNPGAVEGAYVETFSSNLARLLFYSIGLPTHYVGDQLLLVILSQGWRDLRHRGQLVIERLYSAKSD